MPALDGLRGLLAALVVVDHAAAELGHFGLGIAADIAVSIFFVLSGLVLTRGWNGNFPLFLVRRFVRLWPVFAICLAAAGLLAMRVPAIPGFFWIPLPRYDARELCPPMWSLFIEAWAALAMPAIAWSSGGGLLRTLVCMAACVSVPVFWPPDNLALRAFISYLVCFVAGAGLSRTTLRSPILESAIPQWLGRVSYSLYLTHWLVLRAMTRAFGTPGTLTGIVLAFIVAWIVWVTIERPSIRLSRRISF